MTFYIVIKNDYKIILLKKIKTPSVCAPRRKTVVLNYLYNLVVIVLILL